MLATTRVAAVVLVCACTFTSVTPAPHRTVTYNQTQHGHHNVQADLENILILIVPSRKFIGSAMNIFDRRDIPSQKNIPEPPEIATEAIKEHIEKIKPVTEKIKDKNVDKVKPVVAVINLPEPPEPAKPEVTTQKAVVVTSSQVVSEKLPSPSSTPETKKSGAVTSSVVDTKPQVISTRGARGSIITAKLLGFGVSPASE